MMKIILHFLLLALISSHTALYAQPEIPSCKIPCENCEIGVKFVCTTGCNFGLWAQVNYVFYFDKKFKKDFLDPYVPYEGTAFTETTFKGEVIRPNEVHNTDVVLGLNHANIKYDIKRQQYYFSKTHRICWDIYTRKQTQAKVFSVNIPGLTPKSGAACEEKLQVVIDPVITPKSMCSGYMTGKAILSP